MNPSNAQHLQRIQAALDPTAQVASVADYLTKQTKIKGKPYSFYRHEYQKVLLEDTATVKICSKCSQIGISELSVRRAIALTQLQMEVNVLYILPTAGFASTFSSTRFATALDSCKPAKESLYKTDSATVKRFLNDSYIYLKGASKSGQAISVPVNHLIGDEVDFCENQDVLTSFKSRMSHAESDEESEFYFSTPTVPGYGISHLYENSLQHVEVQKCCHCNHQFIPDYYEHVVVPGFNVKSTTISKLLQSSTGVDRARSLKEFNFLNKILLTKFPIKDAYLECPKCRRAVDQDVRYREFIQFNPDSNFDEHGYRVTPFSAPYHMPPPKMVRASASYRAQRDFVNNTLGLPYEDETTGLTEEELKQLFTSHPNHNVYPEHPPYQVSGCDMGGTSSFLSAYPAPDGHLRIMASHRLPLHTFKEEYTKLIADNNVISSVIDFMPYSDTVATLQQSIHSLFACVFTNSKSTQLYAIREQEEDEEKASYGVRQINAQRDALLDFVVTYIRAGKVSFAPTQSNMEEMDVVIAHLRDLKRIQITNKEGESVFTWRKSAAGADHFFFAMAYLLLSNFIKGLSGGMAPLPMLACGMKVKTEV